MSTFCISAQYVRMSLKEPYKCTKVAVNDFVGLFGYKQTFFTPKVDQVILDSNEIFRGVKNYVFWKMTPGNPTWWV